MRGERNFNALTKEELVELAQKNDKEIEALNGLLKKVFAERVIYEQKSGFDKRPSEKGQEDMITKIVSVLKSAERPLQSSEILTLLKKFDDQARYWRNQIGTLSTFLNRALKYKRIYSYKIPGIKAYYYILPEWQQENGELKIDYKQAISNPY